MKSLLISALLFLALVCRAQQGTVLYKVTMKFNIHFDGADSVLAQSMPKEHSSMKKLSFTTDQFILQNEKESQEADDQEISGGNKIVIKTDEGNDKIYCDLKTLQKTEQRGFMDRNFLIVSNLGDYKWKLTGQHKKILNYDCQQAVLADTGRHITVWFTPEIAISAGPEGLGNLPGLILEAELNNGQVIATATSVDLKTAVNASVFVIPHEGKKMTKDEFNKMVKEKTAEMDDGKGDGGNVIIKIKH